MKTVFLSLTIAAIILLLAISKTFGCRCQKKPSVKKEIKTSEIVVSGTILSKEIIDISGTVDNIPYKMQQACYKMLVQKKYKGNFTQDTLCIQTGLDENDCGFDFKIGKKYIVYSSKGQFTKPENFSTSICTRTRRYGFWENVRIKAKIKK